MAVAFKLGNVTDEVGTGDFLHAFFSTISANLERDGWGARFPTLLKKLYRGCLAQEDCERALRELEEIVEGLRKLPPENVVWDISHRENGPPWGRSISSEITDLSHSDRGNEWQARGGFLIDGDAPRHSGHGPNGQFASVAQAHPFGWPEGCSRHCESASGLGRPSTTMWSQACAEKGHKNNRD